MKPKPVEQFVVRRFTNLYGAPEAANAKAFVEEYRKALDGTQEDILEAASDLVVKEHKYRNWPTVGECIAAVEKIALQRARIREFTEWSKPVKRGRTPTPEERARVAALVSETVSGIRAKHEENRQRFANLPPVDRDAWEGRHGRPPTDPPAPWASEGDGDVG